MSRATCPTLPRRRRSGTSRGAKSAGGFSRNCRPARPSSSRCVGRPSTSRSARPCAVRSCEPLASVRARSAGGCESSARSRSASGPLTGWRPSLLVGIVSVSVLAQMRPATHQGFSAAGLESADTMQRPDAYRDWILVSGAADRVYINPSSYREYAKTGIFPEGTVFVWEAGARRGVSHEGPHATSSTLLASLKDSTKFEGGWGFFDFGATGGAPQAKVRALPESRGCRSCHRQSPLSLGA